MFYKSFKSILISTLTAGFITVFVADTSDEVLDTSPTQKWIALFDGKTLRGWSTIPGGTWTVENGSIVGRSSKSESRHGLLIGDKKFSDFEIKLQYKAITGNSGLYFRVDKVNDLVGVHGFQAEIDPEKDAGGLYETGGRAWVVKPTLEEVKKWQRNGKWNDMMVKAQGRNITVWINNFKTAELKNDPGRLEGYIALQLHGGMDMHVLFRNIYIREMSKQ